MAAEILRSCAAAAVVALAMTAALVRWPERLGIWDVPNQRSSHDVPKPRTGGIAMFAAWCVGIALLGGELAPEARLIFSGAGGFFLLGLADDRWRLPEWSRLLVQVIVSTGLVVAGLRLKVLGIPGLGGAPVPSGVLTVIWLCGFVNLFNFMDGIDGIAASQAVIAGVFLGILTPERPVLIVAAAAAGFLKFNAPPSRIFMGDSGSYLLGSVLAISVVRGSGHAPLPSLVLVFAMFLADTLVTLFRRISAGETWYKAHRSHFYQRLVASGWSHARVASVYSAMSIAFGAAAVLYVKVAAVARGAIIACCIGGIAFLFGWISRRKSR